jgi:hypothetical protein
MSHKTTTYQSGNPEIPFEIGGQTAGGGGGRIDDSGLKSGPPNLIFLPTAWILKKIPTFALQIQYGGCSSVG